VELSELVIIGDGNHASNYPKSSEMVAAGIPFIRGVNLVDLKVSKSEIKFITPEKHKQLKKGHLKTGDVLFENRGDIGKLGLVGEDFNNANLNSQLAWLRPKDRIISLYLLYVLGSDLMQGVIKNSQQGATLKQFTIKQLKELKIPLLPLEIQKQLVAGIEGQEKIIEANKKLVGIMEQKITEVLSEI